MGNHTSLKYIYVTLNKMLQLSLWVRVDEILRYLQPRRKLEELNI